MRLSQTPFEAQGEQGKQGGAPEKKQIPRSSTPPHAKSACGGDPGYARDDNSL